MKLAYYCDPESDKPVLLLVHGFMVSRRAWALNLELQNDFRLVIVDLPGHGESGPPLSLADYRPSRINHALESIRQELDIPAWHLCGQSLGGAVVLWHGYYYPQTTLSVSLTNANMALREIGESDPDELRCRADKIRSKSGQGVREDRFHPAQARRFPSELRIALAQDADSIDRQVAANYIEYALCDSIGSKIKEIKSPLMLINGIYETSFQPLRNRLKHMRPDAEIVDLEGGHAINVECASGFNQAIRQFIHQIEFPVGSVVSK